MDEIRLIGFSKTDIDLISKIRGLEGFQIFGFDDFSACTEQEISTNSLHSFILFESHDANYDHHWQNIRSQIHAHQKISFCYLFPYGYLEAAKTLHQKSKINFYLERPYSHYLLVSNLLAMYYGKNPLSHVIEEVLELSLDSGSHDIAEYIAQFKRRLFTNY
ncbi:hypothetical protein MJH12_06355 [bacterium]|nr:hypothetical protein [bacterium]